MGWGDRRTGAVPVIGAGVDALPPDLCLSAYSLSFIKLAIILLRHRQCYGHT